MNWKCSYCDTWNEGGVLCRVCFRPAPRRRTSARSVAPAPARIRKTRTVAPAPERAAARTVSPAPEAGGAALPREPSPRSGRFRRVLRTAFLIAALAPAAAVCVRFILLLTGDGLVSLDPALRVLGAKLSSTLGSQHDRFRAVLSLIRSHLQASGTADRLRLLFGPSQRWAGAVLLYERLLPAYGAVRRNLRTLGPLLGAAAASAAAAAKRFPALSSELLRRLSSRF